MGRLPVDVLRFIDGRFPQRDRDSLLSMLDEQPSLSPRILRSVLYLSDGSISLFRHYLHEAETNVRDVIVAAEYVSGIGDKPLHVRDMGEPFHSDKNLGNAYATTGRRQCHPPPHRHWRAGRCDSKSATSHHPALVNLRFQLGRITYVIMADQPYRRSVRCFRIDATVTTIVRLPLEFVLEQVAEHIELKSLRSAG